MAYVETTRIRVEAPDAGAAFTLEERLAHLHASAVERHGAWGVELEPTNDRLPEVGAAIRYWLHETHRRSAAVTFDGTPQCVALDGDDDEALGAGYDEPALEHEP